MSRQPDSQPRETGFVLIGVVIFVLALTIIGISLFSLSSYEAQFLHRSLDREQAFHSAVGAMERAKFVLTLPGAHFRDVKDDPPDGTTAVAWSVQGGIIDSVNGTVDWDTGNPVFVRVTAGSDGDRRMVEAWFTPTRRENYYRQLITTGGGIEVRPVGIYPPSSRAGTVTLRGGIWETSGQPVSDWWQWLGSPLPDTVRRSPPVPVPAVGDFIATHVNMTTPGLTHAGDPLDPVGAYVSTFELTGGPVHPVYFTSDDTGNPTWSLFEGTHIDLNEVRVSGCAVWLLPRGVQFYQLVSIVGTGPAASNCLVIVAGRNGPVPNTDDAAYGMGTAGIWFRGGLKADIPVILVSDGKVVIWHDNNYTGGPIADGYADEIGIFAESVSLMGPEAGNTMTLQHPPSGRLENHLLPRLMAEGALPNLSSPTGRNLTLQPGTWRASTP